jgi:hypothetical protein
MLASRPVCGGLACLGIDVAGIVTGEAAPIVGEVAADIAVQVAQAAGLARSISSVPDL